MEKVRTIIETKHFIECPHCNNSKSRIDHLFNDGENERGWGPWYCDECGFAFSGLVKGTDVYVKKLDKRKDKSIVFLRNGNVLLAVEGMYFDGEHDKENDRYFFEEHTCPTNYFKNISMVIDLENGDTDPHGIFKFCGSIPFVDLEQVEDVRLLLGTDEKALVER